MRQFAFSMTVPPENFHDQYPHISEVNLWMLTSRRHYGQLNSSMEIRDWKVLNYVREVVCLCGLVSICLATLGCSLLRQELSTKTFSIFPGFIFVGFGIYHPKAGGVEAILPAHGAVSIPFPDRPRPKVVYIFHPLGPVDDERLALEDLPARLRSAGIEIVTAPKSNRDLIYPFVGGPLFRIRIKEGTHEGLIYNQIDPNLGSQNDPRGQAANEDYVLLWLK